MGPVVGAVGEGLRDLLAAEEPLPARTEHADDFLARHAGGRDDRVGDVVREVDAVRLPRLRPDARPEEPRRVGGLADGLDVRGLREDEKLASAGDLDRKRVALDPDDGADPALCADLPEEVVGGVLGGRGKKAKDRGDELHGSLLGERRSLDT